MLYMGLMHNQVKSKSSKPSVKALGKWPQGTPSCKKPSLRSAFWTWYMLGTHSVSTQGSSPWVQPNFKFGGQSRRSAFRTAQSTLNQNEIKEQK